MKKIIISFILAHCIFCFAQDATKESNFEQQKKEKQLRKELNEKVGKQAKKEGARLIKEGWETPPGDLPLKNKLDGFYIKRQETDSEGYPAWYTAFAQSTGNTQMAAKLAAIELAKLELSAQLASNISGLIESSLVSNSISADEASNIQKVVAASNNVISTNLARVVTLVEIYKKTADGNTQCAVHVGTNAKVAEQTAKKAIRKKLEEETNVVKENLDKILGLDQ